jgi:16S rRNA (uracil1498-N3)-methyltransferase
MKKDLNLPCFFISDAKDGTISLDDREARHIFINRIKPGERIIGLDGLGKRYISRLTEVKKSSAKAIIEEIEEVKELNPRLFLGFSPPSPSRLDWLIEKATEIGLHSFLPIYFKRSIRRSVANPERLMQKMKEALKQSQGGFLPKIAPAQEIGDIGLASFDAVLYATPEGTCLAETPDEGSVLLLVGPEGDFTDEEKGMLKNLPNAHPITLGDNRLRLETACICLLSHVSLSIFNKVLPKPV